MVSKSIPLVLCCAKNMLDCAPSILCVSEILTNLTWYIGWFLSQANFHNYSQPQNMLLTSTVVKTDQKMIISPFLPRLSLNSRFTRYCRVNLIYASDKTANPDSFIVLSYWNGTQCDDNVADITIIMQKVTMI